MCTILFWDDDQFEMQAFLDRLDHQGFDTVNCDSPKRAKKLLEEGLRPSLIISDLIWRSDPRQTPEQVQYAGIDFCRFVKESLELECPIIVLTVVTDPVTLKAVKKYAKAILNKPINPGELVGRVKQELEYAKRRKDKTGRG